MDSTLRNLTDAASRSVFGNPWDIRQALFQLTGLVIVYAVVLRPLYNVYFHPLRKYPGPRLWAASSIPWGFKFMNGNWHHTILDLHRQYGHVIRIGPNELSYDVPEAWDDVYGRSKGRKENPKPTWYLSPRRKEIVGAEEKDHTRMRKLLGPGFTATSMYDQEPLIKQNVDLLMERFAERTREGGGETTLDILEWFSFCTFDIIADMTFGQSFGCLRESKLHPWLGWAFDDVKLSHKLVLSFRLPFFAIFLPLLDIWRLWRNGKRFEANMRGYIDQRLARGEPEQWDFVQLMRNKKGKVYMTDDEMYRNTGFLTLAGSETTSMASSVALYYIGTYPEAKAKVIKELSDAFASEEEITLRSAAAKLPYLMAVIEESMRHHPPGPNSLWRVTPPGGNVIMGDFVPGNTILGVPHRVMYRSEHNFKHADQFIPERWMNVSEDSPFANDRREAFHPFSYGPRTCLAMNLAYAELRYILARLLWNFDFEIAPENRNWTTTLQSWLIWEYTPLNIVLKPKKR